MGHRATIVGTSGDDVLVGTPGHAGLGDREIGHYGMVGSRQFIVPDRFTIADIILFCALDFGQSVGQAIPSDTPKVKGWFDRVASRPSAKSSLHPAAAQTKMQG